MIRIFETVLSLLKIGVKSPSKFISKINSRNIKTLIHALKHESKEELVNNFTKIINSSPSLPPSPSSSSYLDIRNSRLPSNAKFGATLKIKQKKVVIIGELGLYQCKKYRVLQKLELFSRANILGDFSHWADQPRALKCLQTATGVIFYRVPYNDISKIYLKECKRLGLNIGYDIDDPIFDLEIYRQNPNLDFISKKERDGILNGSKNYYEFMNYCDYFIASTPGMLNVIKDNFLKPVFLLRNLMDSQTLSATRYSEATFFKKKGEAFQIIYVSGSRAHEADAKIVLSTLEKMLREYPHVELKIIGKADILGELRKKFSNRVLVFPIQSYYDYIVGFRGVDLNIIPLVADEFNDCKSAIRYMEASLQGIPTIVSKIGDFVNLIEHGKTGFIVDNEESAWYGMIKKFIDDDKLSTQIGLESQQFVMNQFTSLQYNQHLKNELLEQF